MKSDKTVINKSIVPPEKNVFTLILFIEFAPNMAIVLGFDPDYRYTFFFLFYQRRDEEIPISPFPPQTNGLKHSKNNCPTVNTSRLWE